MSFIILLNQPIMAYFSFAPRNSLAVVLAGPAGPTLETIKKAIEYYNKAVTAGRNRDTRSPVLGLIAFRPDQRDRRTVAVLRKLIPS